MILLFEEYNYPVSTLRDVLSEYGYMCTEIKGDKAKVKLGSKEFYIDKKGKIVK